MNQQQSKTAGVLLALCAIVFSTLLPQQAAAIDFSQFKRIPTQYIAALADPDANAGSGAQNWGLWRKDPGPRGVNLKHFKLLLADGGIAPARWKFDDKDWWLEEHGLIMEAPEFPLPPGKYLVTGDRKVMTVLTVHPADDNGDSRWELDHGASIYDVTHLRCRSARYTPVSEDSACSPEQAPRDVFRVTPGEPMPEVAGCSKQDYAVLFVYGVGIENESVSMNTTTN